MKLSEWARRHGVPYKTAWRWVRQGWMPVPVERMPTGTILVREPEPAAGGAALYARVASPDQQPDLDRQVARLAAYAAAHGLTVTKVVAEVGTGLGRPRARLLALLADPTVTTIVVERRDRLMRFGFEYVEAALAAHGRRIAVVDPGEDASDLLQDIRLAVSAFCACLYGPRRGRTRAKRAMAAFEL